LTALKILSNSFGMFEWTIALESDRSRLLVKGFDNLFSISSRDH